MSSCASQTQPTSEQQAAPHTLLPRAVPLLVLPDITPSSATQSGSGELNRRRKTDHTTAARLAARTGGNFWPRAGRASVAPVLCFVASGTTRPATATRVSEVTPLCLFRSRGQASFPGRPPSSRYQSSSTMVRHTHRHPQTGAMKAGKGGKVRGRAPRSSLSHARTRGGGMCTHPLLCRRTTQRSSAWGKLCIGLVTRTRGPRESSAEDWLVRVRSLGTPCFRQKLLYLAVTCACSHLTQPACAALRHKPGVASGQADVFALDRSVIISMLPAVCAAAWSSASTTQPRSTKRVAISRWLCRQQMKRSLTPTVAFLSLRHGRAEA